MQDLYYVRDKEFVHLDTKRVEENIVPDDKIHPQLIMPKVRFFIQNIYNNATILLKAYENFDNEDDWCSSLIY